MLACTDAALGQVVVNDERIPSRIRQGLNVESGLNDRICVPLFFIALARQGGRGDSIHTWTLGRSLAPPAIVEEQT